MMRVLVVSHTYLSPINRDKWKAIVNLTSKSPAPCSIDIIVPEKWPSCLFDHEVKMGIIEEGEGYRFHALPVVSAGNEVTYRYAWRALLKIMREVRPTIIHVEQGMHALCYSQLIICARLLRLHARFLFFTWVNWEPARRWSDLFLWDWVARFNRFCSAGAIVGNQRARELLVGSLGKKPVLVLPQLGVNKAIFKPAVTRGKRIMFVGRFVPEKGIFLLLEACAHFISFYPEWELLFIGKGPEEQALKAKIVQLGLSSQVSVLPPVMHDQLQAFYERAAIVVLPSYDTPAWREQFGHVLIEAMASQVAVVGSDAGEIPHVIADTGLIFKQGDSQHLGACLKMLMNNSQLREQYARKGYERALMCYTHEAIAQKTLAFWSQLMK